MDSTQEVFLFEKLRQRYGLMRLILGVFFVLGGLGAFYLFGQVHTLTCERTQGRQNCHMDISWMGVLPLQSANIPPLQSAWVRESSCDTEGCVYQVILRTTGGDIPFWIGPSSGTQSKEEMAQKIEAFLKDSSQPTLEVKTGGGLWILLPLVFLVVGLWLSVYPLLSILFPAEKEP